MSCVLKMMRNKKAKFVICGCVVIVIFWCILQYNTNSIVKQIEDAVYSDVYYAVSDNGLITEDYLLLKEHQVKYEEYNWSQIFDNYKVYFSPTRGISIDQYIDGYILENVDIHCSYSLHNFISGYIWIVIHYDVINRDGDLIYSQEGGPSIGIKFKIKRINGKWKIVDFYEQNSYESVLEQIFYMLPSWNLKKQ